MKTTYYLGMEPSKLTTAFNIWYTMGSNVDFTVFKSVKTPGLIVVALTMNKEDYNEILIADRIVKSTGCQVSMKNHQ